MLEKEYPDITKAGLIDKAVVRKELQEMLQCSKKLIKLDIVFSHEDFHAGNMIWNGNTNTLSVVDWEGSHIGYQGLDVSYFLQIFRLSKLLGIPGFPEFTQDYADCKTELFLNTYFDKWTEINKNGARPTSEERKNFFDQVDYFSLWNKLAMVIIMTVLHVAIDKNVMLVNPYDMINNFYDCYCKMKDPIFTKLNLK